MRALPLLLCTALAVSGCNVLPGAGPTAGAIASGAETVTSEGVFARY
ncbi:H+/gluconate symporter-like permease, partial [Methylobacterium sp. BE186]|nr:H+/gluconate symporter-like permease [Methylobacterium sp. BE186]